MFSFTSTAVLPDIPLALRQYSTEVKRFVYKTIPEPVDYCDPDEVAVPVDLTGWTARLSIRDRTTNTIVFTLTSPTEIVLGADGSINITFDNSNTQLLSGDNYDYDLLLIDPTNEPIRIFGGPVIVIHGITT